MAKKLARMHPGEVLREEFLVPLNLSAGALAKACGLPRTALSVSRETTGITVDTALRLGKALDTSNTYFEVASSNGHIHFQARIGSGGLDALPTSAALSQR